MMYAGDMDKESTINVLMWALPILLKSVPLDQVMLHTYIYLFIYLLVIFYCLLFNFYVYFPP